MKRAILYLLVISTFMAPLAWALDAHAEAFSGHTSISVEQAMASFDDANHDLDQSDHCDHGLAHLTTILSSQSPVLNSQFDQHAVPLHESIATITLVPPYRPPACSTPHKLLFANLVSAA